jgi:hypothetical protein
MRIDCTSLSQLICFVEIRQLADAWASLNGEPAMAVNEKNLENQKRRLRFRQLTDYFFRFSCFFQSGLKHR